MWSGYIFKIATHALVIILVSSSLRPQANFTVRKHVFTLKDILASRWMVVPLFICATVEAPQAP